MAFMDKWEIALEDKIEELKKCQASKGLNSCLGCKEINNCDTRNSYLTAVYESMNRGESGGFEF